MALALNVLRGALEGVLDCSHLTAVANALQVSSVLLGLLFLPKFSAVLQEARLYFALLGLVALFLSRADLIASGDLMESLGFLLMQLELRKCLVNLVTTVLTELKDNVLRGLLDQNFH